MADLSLPVTLALDSQRIIQVPFTSNITVEDVCIYICKKLGIGTLARHLVGIRTGKNLFLRPNDTFDQEVRPGRLKSGTYEFRIRFKTAHIGRLKKLDYSAYNYYFHQAKNDVLDSKVPEFNYEKCRRELLGLVTIDMYRVMLEKGLSRDTVERDYKKYVPKELLKKHYFFIKRPIHDTLVKFEQMKSSNLDVDFLKSQYIYQFEEKAPEYLSEIYKAQLDPEKCSIHIVIKVIAPHLKDGGIKYYKDDDSKKEQWIELCAIEDLGFISIGQAGEMQLSRKTGIVINLKFSSRDVLWSFVTLLDGYSRLSCRWTFNLCKELETKSLSKLLKMKCHGPVGGEFSYAKLEAKTNNRLGCFIIRESETSYSTYYIDACIKEGAKPKTFKLEKFAENEYFFHFDDDLKRYSSIQELLAEHRKSDIYLNECIPPSEFDVSPLLLCRSDIIVGDDLTDVDTLPTLNQPRFINIKDLQFYKENLGEPLPGNRTDLSQCKLSHLGVEYTGSIGKTESNVRCQSWSSNQPHKVREEYTDQKFPFGSKKASKNYCRNPDKNPTGPWCYTMNSDLIDETCSIPLCSISECRLTGPGMEYGGKHDKGTSGRHCNKWDKDRKKVLENGNYTRISMFSAKNFPEDSLSKAKKFCRNPNGDIGGPWCFVEHEEMGYIEREYCDIPFCYDPECSVFTKNYDTYMHFTDFNGSVFTDIKFSIKLWDSDNFNDASARLVLSVLALPLTGKEIADLGIGIEIYISNKESALRYGNKDSPDYEPTPGILTSSNFTTFTLNWDRGFITLGIEGKVKPIFLAEIKTKKNLLGLHKDMFYFYSVQGTNVIWSFPFCLDDDECDVHTTTGGQFQQFWPLRQKDIVLDLYVHIRAFRSAAILVTPSPTVDFPYFKIVFNGPNGHTRIILKEFKTAKENVLKEIQLEGIVDYWQWNEFSISFFANSLQIYMKKAIGMHSLLESKEESFRKLRWFSVSSENAMAHWSFFCQPPHFAEPPMALLPE